MTMVADDLSDLPNGWLVENVLDDAATDFLGPVTRNTRVGL